MTREITRRDYEAGRLRRRDGQDFQIHAWHDETGMGRILGEVKRTDGSWGFQHWDSEGKCRADGESPLDLILAPRIVYTNLYRDGPDKLIGAIHDTHGDAVKAALRGAVAVAISVELEEP